jgi:hypothetical protein
MDLTEIECYGLEWINLAQDRGKQQFGIGADGGQLCICGNELSGSIKCGEFLD